MAPPTASAPLPIVDRAVAAVPAVTLGAPPVQRATFVDAPNLQGDDAPPSLPASLHGGMPTGPAVPQPAKALPLQQPPSVQATAVDAQVKPASAEQPVGIQLINPASAQVEAPIEDGLQQAIYFEASDQPAP